MPRGMLEFRLLNANYLLERFSVWKNVFISWLCGKEHVMPHWERLASRAISKMCFRSLGYESRSGIPKPASEQQRSCHTISLLCYINSCLAGGILLRNCSSWNHRLIRGIRKLPWPWKIHHRIFQIPLLATTDDWHWERITHRQRVSVNKCVNHSASNVILI